VDHPCRYQSTQKKYACRSQDVLAYLEVSRFNAARSDDPLSMITLDRLSALPKGTGA
jgi:hypothetical protein